MEFTPSLHASNCFPSTNQYIPLQFQKDVPIAKPLPWQAVRKKMNPEAIRVMSNEFISNIYDSDKYPLKKFKDLYVLGIAGSKFILPNTKENEFIFGRSMEGNQPVQGLLSTLHDCLNSVKLDVLVGSVFDSERAHASRHIQHFCENYIGKAIFIFDRG